MADTCLWKHDPSGEESHDPRVLSASFGDGYVQRVPDGINADLGTWSVSFTNRPMAEATAIANFFRERKGAIWFWWRPEPDADLVKVVAKPWKKTPVTRYVATVTATFTEVCDPGE